MTPSFQRQLSRVRRVLTLGRLLAAILATAGIMAWAWVVFGVADGIAGFETSSRKSFTLILIVFSAVVFLYLLARALRVRAHDTAVHADSLTGDPRRSASAAHTLEPGSSASPLAELLAQRTRDDAAKSLSALPSGKIFPWRLVGRAAVLIALAALLVAGIRIARPAAFSVVAERLVRPDAELPPYSRLTFQITPAKPQALYGSGLDLQVEITGGALKAPVECLVRRLNGGEVLKLPAFRVSASRFSRRLDGLTEPVEISFASGRARSRWVPVEILLEPKILAGVVKVAPPAYTGLPASQFNLDTNEISAIEGSRIQLQVTSNRPLAKGTLVFTPAAIPGTEPVPETLHGESSGTHQVTFSFVLSRPGRISANVTDLRGTSAPQPLDVALRPIPDRAPAVELSSPPSQLLATPTSVIRVTGAAEDDFALSKMQFVRTLAGFRDRVRVVAPELHDKSYRFDEKLNLYDLGLEAGQVVELMLEASDRNPSLLGHGSSPVARIKIISDEQYAAYLRSKTTLSQFGARFDAAREAIEEARDALDKLRDSLEKGDAAAAAKALEDAKKAHREAAGLLEKIAGDFSAFDLEKRLADLAEKQAQDLRGNLETLGQFDPAAGPDGIPKVDEMTERLGRQQEQEQQLDQDANAVRTASAFLEMAAKFRQIYENQVSVAKRFRGIVEELRHGENQNRRMLPSLAEAQRKNREALEAFKIELKKRLDEVDPNDPTLQSFIESAADFLNELQAAEPETLMDAASNHGKAGQANDAFTNAELARALLERLLSEPEPFPEAVMGKAPELGLPNPDVNETLQQMLEGLMGQNPSEGEPNPGQGGAQGMAGRGGNGAAANGIPMNLPVVGPDRMQFEPLGGPSKNGTGNGRPGAVAPLPETAETGILPSTENRQGTNPTLSPESVPEPYREAVKRFFTP